MGLQIQISSGGSQATSVYDTFPYGLQFYCTYLETGNPAPDVQIDVSLQTAPNGATGFFATGGPEVNYITLVSGPDGFTNLVGLYANGIEGDWDLSFYLWIPFSGPSGDTYTNLPPSGTPEATSINVTAGSGQTVDINTALPVSVKATVLDQYGAAVGAGTSVTATAPATGASGIFSTTGTRTKTVVTGAGGTVDFGTFTSNAVEGAFNISITAPGVNGTSALVTIKIPTGEVCTPESQCTLAYQSATNWVDPIEWFMSTAQSSGVFAGLGVDGSNTPAQSVFAYRFDESQLALINNLARITSITLSMSAYVTKNNTYYPTNFRAWITLADRGRIIASNQSLNASTIENTWTNRTRTWTTFTNTGQAGNLLYGFQLKNDNLRPELEFYGESGNVGGSYKGNGARLIVCYINPEGGDIQQSLELCIF